MLTHLAYREALIPVRDAIPMAFKIGTGDIDMSSEGNTELVFKDTQFERLVSFLDTGTRPRFYTDDFGDPKEATHILAFSYGAHLPVNRALADRILDIVGRGGPKSISAQWEIADQLAPFKITGPNPFLHLNRIGIEPSENKGDSGYRILDPKKLAESGFVPGLSPSCPAEKMPAIIDEKLRDLSIWAKMGYMQYETGDFDDPLPMARFVLNSETARHTEAVRMGNDTYKPDSYMGRSLAELSLTGLMMFAPKGSMEFYITSKGVVDAFKRNRGIDDKGRSMSDTEYRPSVFVIAQAWHAPRVLQLCKANGLNVTGGSFVNMFSENDPQIWTTNPFSWLIKEAGVWADKPELFPA